jgi:hypothetical protein
MGILSWLKGRRRSSEDSEPANEDVEQQQDERKAEIDGTLFVRGSAHSEAERLSGDD